MQEIWKELRFNKWKAINTNDTIISTEAEKDYNVGLKDGADWRVTHVKNEDAGLYVVRGSVGRPCT